MVEVTRAAMQRRDLCRACNSRRMATGVVLLRLAADRLVAFRTITLPAACRARVSERASEATRYGRAMNTNERTNKGGAVHNGCKRACESGRVEARASTCGGREDDCTTVWRRCCCELSRLHFSDR